MEMVYFLLFLTFTSAWIANAQECSLDTDNSKIKLKMAKLSKLVDKVLCENQKSRKEDDSPRTSATEGPTLAPINSKDEMCGEAFVPNPNSPKTMVHCFISTQILNSTKPNPIKSMDPNLCTHAALFGFLTVDSYFRISLHPKTAEDFENLLATFAAKKILVILGFGSAEQVSAVDMSKMAGSETKRKVLVASFMEIVDKYDLHGVLIDWTYPVFPDNDYMNSKKKDFINFPALVKEISEKCKPKNRIVCIRATNLMSVTMVYDFAKLNTTVDLWFMDLYHFEGPWSFTTAISSPTRRLEDLLRIYDSYVPRKKMIMGIPANYKPVVVEDKKNSKIGSKVKKNARVKNANLYVFRNLCEEVAKGGVKVVHNETDKINSYAFKDGEWVSYDSSQVIKKKMEILLANELGGAYLEHLEDDDFDGKACNCGKFHLLRSLNEALRGSGSCAVPLCP